MARFVFHFQHGQTEFILGYSDPDPASGTRDAALYWQLCAPMLFPCAASS